MVEWLGTVTTDLGGLCSIPRNGGFFLVQSRERERERMAMKVTAKPMKVTKSHRERRHSKTNESHRKSQ